MEVPGGKAASYKRGTPAGHSRGSKPLAIVCTGGYEPEGGWLWVGSGEDVSESVEDEWAGW